MCYKIYTTTLSVQKLGIVLAQKNSEFLIFWKGLVKNSNFWWKSRFLLTGSRHMFSKIPMSKMSPEMKNQNLKKIFTLTRVYTRGMRVSKFPFISNPVYIFHLKWVALFWPSYHDGEVEKINFWRHLKIENPIFLFYRF